MMSKEHLFVCLLFTLLSTTVCPIFLHLPILILENAFYTNFIFSLERHRSYDYINHKYISLHIKIFNFILDNSGISSSKESSVVWIMKYEMNVIFYYLNVWDHLSFIIYLINDKSNYYVNASTMFGIIHLLTSASVKEIVLLRKLIKSQ